MTSSLFDLGLFFNLYILDILTVHVVRHKTKDVALLVSLGLPNFPETGYFTKCSCLAEEQGYG